MDTNATSHEKSRMISLSDEGAVKESLTNAVFGLWEVINNLTRLRPSHKERYRVTIFGSARALPQSHVYDEVKRLAQALAEMGCDIVTGGGPGLMQAANEGATAAGASERNRSIGIRVDLPFEQDVNPFVELAFEHGTFFSRLHHFVLASDAFVVTPGGIGTVLEATMVWQLLQVKHLEGTPLIFIGKMWEEFVAWASKHMLSSIPPLAGSRDMTIPICLTTADEAIVLIRKHHAAWKRSNRTPGSP